MRSRHYSSRVVTKVSHRVIGDVPVGYKDLVEVRFATGRALETSRLVTNTSSHSALGDAEKLLLTCRRREVPRNSRKVRAGNHRRAAHSGGSRGFPRCGMG